MSFLKKEIKRIGYLAKPLKPPSNLYETTYSPPQFTPNLAPLKKRRRIYKSPAEYFYDEPYNELMKKMEKEEVQQQLENVRQLMVQDAIEQARAASVEEQIHRMQTDPTYAARMREFGEFLQAAHENPVALAVAQANVRQEQEDVDKIKQNPVNAWVQLKSTAEMLPHAEDAILNSPYISDERKDELLTKSPKEVLESAITLVALPTVIQRRDIKILMKLYEDVFKTKVFDYRHELFKQVKSKLESTFGYRFGTLKKFYNDLEELVDLIEENERYRKRGIRKVDGRNKTLSLPSSAVPELEVREIEKSETPVEVIPSYKKRIKWNRKPRSQWSVKPMRRSRNNEIDDDIDEDTVEGPRSTITKAYPVSVDVIDDDSDEMKDKASVDTADDADDDSDDDSDDEEQRMKRVKEFLERHKNQKRMVGCYLYDFGNKKEASPQIVLYQLNRAKEMLKSGQVEGIVLHTNGVADMGFEAVEVAKKWMEENGDEII